MKQRIIVIDDSYYMRTMLKNILTDAGYNVVAEAANGLDAIKVINEHVPDLVSLDIILPDTTGIEVLKKIREEHPNMKVVMVSAVGQDTIIKEAMDGGALAYIVKPFSEDKVLEIIENIFK